MTVEPTAMFLLGLQLGQWLAIYGVYKMTKRNRRQSQRRRRKAK